MNPLIRKIKTFQNLSGDQRKTALGNYMRRFRRMCANVLYAPVYLPIGIALWAAGIRIMPDHDLSFGALVDLTGHYFKAEKTGVLNKHRRILLAPHADVSNPALLDYWRPYFLVVSNKFFVFLLRPLTRMWLVADGQYGFIGWKHRMTDGRVLKGINVIPYVQLEYEERFGNQKVLTLTSEHHEAGWRNLERCGLDRDDWWVCVQAREAASLGDSHNLHRNVDITTYFDAISLITDLGGWVIRIGDKNMSRLPEMDRVIDYPHTELKSDWMDLFLLSQCRFMISSTSGPYSIPGLFGKPTMAPNWTPFGLPPYSSDVLHTPKLYRSTDDGRLITFADVFKRSIMNVHRDEIYERASIELVDNTAIDIRDLTVEMIEILEDRVVYTSEDDDRQQKLAERREPTLPESLRKKSRGGREFFRSHRELLD